MNIKTLFNHTIAMRDAQRENNLANFQKAVKQYVSAVIFLKILEKTWFSYTISTVLFMQKSEFLKKIYLEIDTQSSINAIINLSELQNLSTFEVLKKISDEEDSENILDRFLHKYNDIHRTAYGHPSHTHFFFDLISSAEIKTLSLCLVVIGLISTIHIIFSAIAITIGLLGILINIVMLSQRKPKEPNPKILDFKLVEARQLIPLVDKITEDLKSQIQNKMTVLFIKKKPESIAQIATLSEHFLLHKEDMTDLNNRQNYQTEQKRLIGEEIINSEDIEQMENTIKPLIIILKKRRVTSIFPSVTETDLNKIVERPQKYNQVIAYEKEISKLNQQLRYLTDTQSGGTPFPSFIVEHHAKSGSCDKLESNFTITVRDRFQGYTLHCFLSTARNYLSKEDIPFTAYKGELRFVFSYSEFKNLQQFLKDLIEWYQKATSMLHALFGEDAAPYISAGSKPFEEVYDSELNRKNQKKFIDPNILEEMKKESGPNQKVQLIEQISLNLSKHGLRSEYKQLLEHFYALCQLTDNKGDNKTFMRTSGAEYTSMLSTVNLKAIAAHIMYHAIIETKARDMGCSSLSDNFYTQFTIPSNPNAIDTSYIENTDYTKTFYAYTLVCLFETSHQILRIYNPKTQYNATENEITTYRAQLQRVNPCDYHALRETLVDSIASILDTYVNVTLNSLVPKELMSVDKVKAFLVAATGPDRLSNFEHYPIRKNEVDALVGKIQASDAYKDAIDNGTYVDVSPGEVSKIQRLATAIINRMNNFKPGMKINNVADFYAPENLIPGLDAFAKIAYKICHAETLGINAETIKNFWQAISNNDSDQEFFSQHFCNAGFSGRLQKIEEDFVTTLSDPIYQAAFFLRSSLSKKLFLKALNDTDPQQTAHNYPQSENINIEIGITTGQSSAARPHTAIRTKFFTQFAQDYSPYKLFDQCYTELINAFQQCQANSDDPGLYRIFKSLEPSFDSQITADDKRAFERKYKVVSNDERSPWSIAKFLDNLPSASMALS